MVSIAERELSDVDAEIGHNPVKGLKRFIRKEPLGVVLTISGTIPLQPELTAAWNYP